MIENTGWYPTDKKELYEEVALQLTGLFDDCPHIIANLSNASALLKEAMEDINWVGFYLLESVEELEEVLVLGPFQGKPACVEIPIGKGVCGTAVKEDRILLVKNVHEFPGHIACDCASNSEIVLPIHVDGKVWGVLDVDSPSIGRFEEEDRDGLEKVVRVIEEMYEKNKK